MKSTKSSATLIPMRSIEQDNSWNAPELKSKQKTDEQKLEVASKYTLLEMHKSIVGLVYKQNNYFDIIIQT